MLRCHARRTARACSASLTADGGRDIMQLTLATSQVTPVLRDRFTEILAEVSPDGRWLAYNSDRSGQSGDLTSSRIRSPKRPVAGLHGGVARARPGRVTGESCST